MYSDEIINYLGQGEIINYLYPGEIINYLYPGEIINYPYPGEIINDMYPGEIIQLPGKGRHPHNTQAVYWSRTSSRFDSRSLTRTGGH